MALEALLPSEVARLVYGYLIDEKCTQAAKVFLEESPNLIECRQVLSCGRHFTTRVCGLVLIDILEKFCLASSIIQDNICNFDNTDKLKQCKDLISQIKLLLEEYQLKKLAFVQPNSVVPNEFPTTDSSCKNKEKEKYTIPSPIRRNQIQDSATEATSLDALPGFIKNSETRKQDVPLKFAQLSEPDRLYEIQNRDSSPFKQFSKSFIKSPIKSSTKSHNKFEVENSNLKQCNKILDKNIAADNSETRLQNLKDFEVQTSLLLSTAVPPLEKELPNECVDILGDVTSELLNQKKFQEKIAENINKVLEPITKNEKSEAGINKPVIDFEKLIGTAVNMTENDPEFIKMLNSIILPDDGISNTDEISVESNSQHIISEQIFNNKNVNVPEEIACKTNANFSEDKFTTHNSSKHVVKDIQNSSKISKTENSSKSLDIDFTVCHSNIQQNINSDKSDIFSRPLENEQTDSVNASLEKPNSDVDNKIDNHFKVPMNPIVPNLEKSLHDSDKFFQPDKTVTSTPLKTYTAVENFEDYEWLSAQTLPSPNLIPSKENIIAPLNPFTFTAQEKIVTMTDSFLSPIVSQEMCKFAQKITSVTHSSTTPKEQTLNTPEVSYLPKNDTAFSSVTKTVTSNDSNIKPSSAQKIETSNDQLGLSSFLKSDTNNINLSSLLKDTNECRKFFGSDSVNLYGQDNFPSTVETVISIPEIEVENSVTLTGVDFAEIVKLRKKSGETSKIELKEQEKIIQNATNESPSRIYITDINKEIVNSTIISQPEKIDIIDKNNDKIFKISFSENVEKNISESPEDKPKRKLSISTPKKQSHIRAISFDTPIVRPQSDSKLNKKYTNKSPEFMNMSLKSLSHKLSPFQTSIHATPGHENLGIPPESLTSSSNKNPLKMEADIKKKEAQPESAITESKKKKKRKSKGDNDELEPTPKKSKKRDKLTPKEEKKDKTQKKSKKNYKDKETPKKSKKKDKSKTHDENNQKKVEEILNEEPEVPKIEASKSLNDALVILLSKNVNDNDMVSEYDVLQLASDESKRFKYYSSTSQESHKDTQKQCLYRSENNDKDRNSECSKSNEVSMKSIGTESSRERDNDVSSSLNSEPKGHDIHNTPRRDSTSRENESKSTSEQTSKFNSSESNFELEKKSKLNEVDEEKSSEKDSELVESVADCKLKAKTPENKSTIDYDKIEEQLNAIMNTPETLNHSCEKRTVIYDQISKVEGGKIVKKKYARLKTLDTNIAKKNIKNSLLTGGYEIILDPPTNDEDSLQIPPTPKIASPGSNSWGMTMTKVHYDDTRTFQSFVTTPLECPPTPNIIITPQKNERESEESKSLEKSHTAIHFEPALALSEIAKKSEITQFEVIKENLHKIMSPVQVVPPVTDNKAQPFESFKCPQNNIEDHNSSIASDSSSSCDSCSSSSSSSSSEDNDSQDEIMNEKIEESEVEKKDVPNKIEYNEEDTNKTDIKENHTMQKNQSSSNDEQIMTSNIDSVTKNDLSVSQSKIIHEADDVLKQAEIVIVNETSPTKVLPINKSDIELQETIHETPAKDENQCLQEEGITDTPSVTKPNENPVNLSSKISQIMLMKEQQEQIKKSQQKPKIIKIERVSPKIVTKPTHQVIKVLPSDIQSKIIENKNEENKFQLKKKSKIMNKNEKSKVVSNAEQSNVFDIKNDSSKGLYNSRSKDIKTKSEVNPVQMPSKIAEKGNKITMQSNLLSKSTEIQFEENKNQLCSQVVKKQNNKLELLSNTEEIRNIDTETQINIQSKPVRNLHGQSNVSSHLNLEATEMKNNKPQAKLPATTAEDKPEKLGTGTHVQTKVVEKKSEGNVSSDARLKTMEVKSEVCSELNLKPVKVANNCSSNNQKKMTELRIKELKIKLSSMKVLEKVSSFQNNLDLKDVDTKSEEKKSQFSSQKEAAEELKREEIPSSSRKNIPKAEGVKSNSDRKKRIEKSEEKVIVERENRVDEKVNKSLTDTSEGSISSSEKSSVLNSSNTTELDKALSGISTSRDSNQQSHESNGESTPSTVIGESQSSELPKPDVNLNANDHSHFTRSKSKETVTNFASNLGLSNCDALCTEYHYVFDEDNYVKRRRKGHNDETLTSHFSIEDQWYTTMPTHLDMIFNINPLRRKAVSKNPKGNPKGKRGPEEVSDLNDDESQESISSRVNSNAQGLKRKGSNESQPKIKKRTKNLFVL